MKLAEALPELAADLEAPLAHLGRGDLIAQVQHAQLEEWSYDDFSNSLLIQTTSREPAETLSLYDELGVNLDLDAHGRLCRIEVLDGEALARRLRGDAR
jgi:hypothetical protein